MVYLKWVSKHLEVCRAHQAHIFYSLDFHGVFSLCQEGGMWLTWIILRDNRHTSGLKTCLESSSWAHLKLSLSTESQHTSAATLRGAVQCQRGSTDTSQLESKGFPRGVSYVAGAPYLPLLSCKGLQITWRTLNQGSPLLPFLLSGCTVNKGAKAAIRLELPFLPSCLCGRGLPALWVAGYSQWGACSRADIDLPPDSSRKLRQFVPA